MQKLFEGGKGSVFQRVLSWVPSHNHQLQLAGALAIANFARNGRLTPALHNTIKTFILSLSFIVVKVSFVFAQMGIVFTWWTLGSCRSCWSCWTDTLRKETSPYNMQPSAPCGTWPYPVSEELHRNTHLTLVSDPFF